MLIDVNAGFGGRETIQRFALGTMLAQLERIPLGLAFVHCNQGASDPTSANGQVLALCRDHPRLQPVGAIHPRETFTWRAEVERCLAAGVRLFRISPDQPGWPATSILLGQVVERLAGSGAALLVEATTPGLPSTVAAATADAAVPVIFTEARYFPLSELLPLVGRYPHLFVETSRITSPEGIERCVETVGAGRLVFGSGTARYPAWVAWQILARADISQADREAIAWRNAARLLGVRPESAAQPAPIPSATAAGRPIVDVHLHDKFPGAPIRPYPPAAYEAELGRRGIAGGVCSSVTAIFYDLKLGNDEVAVLLGETTRLRGYVVVDPRYPKESAEELRRLDRDERFVGVKIHAAYAQTPTRAPAMRRLFDVIATYGRPVLIHNLGEDWPEALVEIAEAHPTLPIIAAHAGYGDGPHPTHDAALRLASVPNVYLEFCSTYLTTGAIRRGIETVGAERVLYGSDFPLIAQPYMLAAYDDAELEPDEASLIFHMNASRLFPSLGSWGGPLSGGGATFHYY
jgi:predicted TIM-barrel fold metal-dependent hydrolase